MTSASTNLSTRPRFPGEIISHALWLSFPLDLSHRDVAERLCVREVIVSSEALRKR